LGKFTDDTQMSLFTAEGLLRCHVLHSDGNARGVRWVSECVNEAYQAYQRWLFTQTGRPGEVKEPGLLLRQQELFDSRGPGGTCMSSLKSSRLTAGFAFNDGKGCGTVMRSAPIGLYAAQQTPGHCFQLSLGFAAVTHGHPSAQLAAGVMAVLVQSLVNGASLLNGLGTAASLLRQYPDHEETLTIVEKAVELSESGMPRDEAIAGLGKGWVAEEALAIAIYCALLARDFRHGVVLAVNHDGDSDSTGSMTGNLLGAMHGVSAIPPDWLEPLELRGLSTEIADDLLDCHDWRLDGSDKNSEFAKHILDKYSYTEPAR
jgi:ADP-ribosylglycohydrolase